VGIVTGVSAGGHFDSSNGRAVARRVRESVLRLFAGQFYTSNLRENGGGNIRGNLEGASTMAKYFLGWILGVPVIVLVIIYLIFN